MKSFSHPTLLLLTGVFAVYISMHVLSCASTGTLSGGPVDKTPPQVVKEKSSQNLITNVKPKTIEIVFDEFIELKNSAKEITISPPLVYRLQAKTRGKKLIFEFNEKEVLKDSVTYIINTGNAIVDFRAGNVLAGYRYIFSTGSYIDSLYIHGKVIDMVSGKPLENIFVGVYDALEDSILIKERPLYYAKTKSNGTFFIDYMKSDTFRVYAFDDKNANSIYNPGQEMIAFLSDDIVLTNDTSHSELNLYLSQIENDLRFLKNEQPYSRSVRLLFNRPLDEVPPFNIDPPTTTETKINKDTLLIWYDQLADTMQLYLPGIDTIALYVKENTPSSSLKLIPITNPIKNDTFYFECHRPIDSLVSSLISVVDTSDNTIEYDLIYTPGKRSFKIYIDTIGRANNYSITFDSASIIDIYKNANDSLTIPLKSRSFESTFHANLKLSGLDTMHQNLITITNPNGIILDTIVSGLDSVVVHLDYLSTEEVNVLIIEDINNNGKWDQANLIGRLQAEKQLNKNSKITEPGNKEDLKINIKSPVSPPDN